MKRNGEKSNTGEPMIGRITRVASCACLLSSVLNFGAFAENHPNRYITMIVPNPPGGATDLVPRLVVDDMGAHLRRQIIIENRDGASGSLGAGFVARATPDGYTLLMTVNPPITMNVYLQKAISYNPRTAFTPIGLAATSPLILVVKSTLPIKTVADLVAYVKQHPGSISYGSAGFGTGQHIVGEWMKKEARMNMIHVPYRGSGPIIKDLISGDIQVGFGTLPAIQPALALGAVRMIAIAEGKRSSVVPDVPTISETLPGIVYDAWYGLLGPAGTPRPIVDQLNSALTKALQNPETVEKMKAQGIVPAEAAPDVFSKKIDVELDKWAQVMPTLGLTPQ